MIAIESTATAGKRRVLAANVAMLAAAVGLFLLIIHFDGSLTPSAAAKAGSRRRPRGHSPARQPAGFGI